MRALAWITGIVFVLLFGAAYGVILHGIREDLRTGGNAECLQSGDHS